MAILEVTGRSLQLNPREMLLFDLGSDCKHKTLVANMLTAAALLLAQKWKSQEIPTITEWLAKIRYMSFWPHVALEVGVIMHWRNIA